jgi:hypothetical protein
MHRFKVLLILAFTITLSVHVQAQNQSVSQANSAKESHCAEVKPTHRFRTFGLFLFAVKDPEQAKRKTELLSDQ